ncbi:hypothetical protein ACHHYP_08925 [Achlya hypogyna]|uniref:HIT-type domain-containing protein n=1 Tax=Achlya hypogyna TaxID=1202772 RepID=A0A1V9ZJW8_ACHHY|nr:hypothetical protein ACHHYP_08925 [Achlya hypogyna]
MDRRGQPPPTPIKVPLRFGATKTTVSATSTIKLTSSEPIGLSNASALRVCGVCTEAQSKYTCPRCNVVYCGVSCYKTHGETCTEHFYKEHVESEMRLNKSVDTSSAHAMQEVIRRVYDEFPDADTDLTADDRRMEELVQLMESDALTLDALTDEERAQFLREVADGRLGKHIALWTPWWTQSPEAYAANTKSVRHQLIVALDEDGEDSDVEVLHDHPRGLLTAVRAKALEPMAALHASPNGRVLRCNLFEVLFAYAYTLRTYNGDWATDAVEASAALLGLSSVLQGNRVYESDADARTACASAPLADKNVAAAKAALADADTMRTAQVFVLDALSDLEALLEAAVAAAPKAARKELRRVAKKVHFYLVWAAHCKGADIL